MKRVIGAQVRGELLERFEEVNADREEGVAESELIREILDDGLAVREVPLYTRLGVSNRVGAQLEDARDEDESQEEVVRRFLTEAVEARERDIFDEVGAPDDLREAVEIARQEGEPEADAVRRLLREGVEAQERDAFDALGGSEQLREWVLKRAEESEEPDETIRRLLVEGVRHTSEYRRAERLTGTLSTVALLAGFFFTALPSSVLAISVFGLTTVDSLVTGFLGVLVLFWLVALLMTSARWIRRRRSEDSF